MSDYVPVSKDTHRDRYWAPVNGYRFAERENLCFIAASELPFACLHLPIGFIQTSSGFLPIVILGLRHNSNVVVGSNGSWLAEYVPREFRTYPFKLALHEENKVLCIDSHSCTSSPEGSRPILKPDGTATDEVQSIMTFLNESIDLFSQTNSICEILETKDLIERWPLKVDIDSETHEIKGLFRINETKLNSLSAESLLELRDSRCLVVIYCQLMSMAHIQKLVNSSQGLGSSDGIGSVLDSMQSDGNISFDNI